MCVRTPPARSLALVFQRRLHWPRMHRHLPGGLANRGQPHRALLNGANSGWRAQVASN